uniref:Ecdysone response nuclear receptor E75D n=1 Tax=Agelena silvatica TaxID=648239 RepID=E5F0Y7_9ARAC|nr:ecdysone response nuclear receptor E75D [Agelena silvatica]
MTSILSRLLTADKPWSVPYQIPVHQYQYSDGVSGNEFPSVAKKKRTKKVQDPSVRFGRVPKREKAKILAAMQKVNACSQEKALCAELEDELRLLTTIVRAHEETCDYTRDKVAGLVEKARTQPVYTQCPPQLACPLNPAPHILENGVSHYMEDFSERFAPAIKGVVEFAKRIPGFGFLSQDDQVTLLKAGVFEVLLVRLACMFDAQANSLICLNGQVLRRESLHTASNARFLLDSMFDFAERLNALHLSDSEVGLFCSVVVIASDRPGLRNKELVTKIQNKLKDILQKSVASSHPENPNIYQDLMKKIPGLRTLNTLHSEKLLAYKMEPRNRQAGAVSSIEGIADHSISNSNAYAVIPHDIWTQYSLVTSHPSCLSQEEDMRSTSPGVQSLHGGSTTGSEWSTTDSKDEHDLVGSPRSIGSGLCVDEVKSPIRTSSFSSSHNYVSEEPWITDTNQVVAYHQHLTKRENPGSEHGSSSGDEGYYIDSPMKGPVYPKLHRVDSPTDSGIESGKEHGPSTTPTISNCSSPRSSVDEKLKDDHRHSPSQEKQDNIEDMPVLKRALQAPPLVNTNMLMDEAYRHHKKFRAARREAESPSSPGQMSLASTHSTLVRTLEQAPRYLSEQQLKRTDLIHNIIMRNETLPSQQSPSLIQHQQSQSQTATQSHHVDALPVSCPSLQNTSYPFSSVPNQTSTLPSTSLSMSNSQQQHKSLLICPSGYYVQHGPNVTQASIYSSSTSVSWPFSQQPSSSAQTVSSPSSVQVHSAQYDHSHLQQNSASFCASSLVVNTSRAGSPRHLYNPRSPVTSTSLVMNGVGLNPSSAQSSVCPNDTRPVQSEASPKPSGESQPLNLSKKLFSPPLLKMET